MKIGITCYPTYGGSGIVATEMGMELSSRGHDVHFITYSNPIRLSEDLPRLHYHEVPISDYPLFQYPPYSLALASRMAKTIESEGLDLLHVHYAIPHSISALLASHILGGAFPFVTTLHGTDVTLVGSDPSFLPITKLSIEQSPAITTISRYLQQETQRVFSTEKEIKVIPNFVNCDRYRPGVDIELRRQYAAPEEKLLIHVSNFRPVKRILDCVRVLVRVNEKIPSRLLMIGAGPDRVPAQELAQKLGVADRIEFIGKQLFVAPLLAIADLCLLPSEMEGFGVVALEAAACGVPTVASNVGGLPEFIDNGSNGFLLPVGDVEAMAAAVLTLFKDEDQKRAFGEAARRSTEMRYSASRIIPQYEAYYEEVCCAN